MNRALYNNNAAAPPGVRAPPGVTAPPGVSVAARTAQPPPGGFVQAAASGPARVASAPAAVTTASAIVARSAATAVGASAQSRPAAAGAVAPARAAAVGADDFPSLGSTAATGSFEDAGTPGLGASLGVSGAVSSASVHLSAALTGSGAANASSSVFSAPAGAARAHSPSPAGSRLPPGSFGLLDLLPVIRATDADVTAMALGTDLNALGLNLNAADVLYPTFGSPWADAPVRRAADYTLPACYYIAPPTLKTSHLSKFAHETLLYVFYNMPRDQMQVLAAKELYNRGWKYHKQLQLWFKSDSAANPAQPVQPLYFDVPTWKTRPFQDIQATRQLAANFMTAEEVMSL